MSVLNTTAQVKKHEGPLPSPEALKQYEKIYPGFAERLLIMAEHEQAHRHNSDQSLIQNQHKQHKRDTDTFRMGQLCAIVAVTGVLLLCYYMVSKNFASAAASIGVAAIVGVIVAFHSKKPLKSESNASKLTATKKLN